MTAEDKGLKDTSTARETESSGLYFRSSNNHCSASFEVRQIDGTTGDNIGGRELEAMGEPG